ncbi:LuxE/PaaK family acyltransferase [Ohtaekwangia sp.]|uniref:LuxE/PaaK family acyltransferase n=1 Tax=Ohtaekwangia sp. TaxID=2066019 RepID=UPI002F922978
MDTFKSFESTLYTVNDQTFVDIAMEVFRFQAVNNPVYRSFIQNFSIDIYKVSSLNDIPFMPVSFFKSHALQTGTWQPEITFTSSGTTGALASRHAVANLKFYQQHSQRCFEYFFGPVSDYHFLALLPSYLERQGSSLIAMMDYFIRQSQSTYSSYYLFQIDKLLNDLEELRRKRDRKIVLWGVSFALLDLAEQHAGVDLSHCLVFETGGMKGRRKEITRAELHGILRERLHVNQVYSEYGMTELLSQAYTRGQFLFECPPWVKIIGRDITDPLTRGLLGETAGINIIDLANYQTVSFIETEDLGKIYEDGKFEVLGRMDNSDVRGCNLMVS